MQQLPDTAIYKLAAICNASLSSGYFPDQWKVSTVKMIPKANKPPRHADHYRPIFLLEVPGKLFEKMLITGHRIR